MKDERPAVDESDPQFFFMLAGGFLTLFIVLVLIIRKSLGWAKQGAQTAAGLATGAVLGGLALERRDAAVDDPVHESSAQALRDAESLGQMPVVVADLHSALPAIIAGLRAARPRSPSSSTSRR